MWVGTARGLARFDGQKWRAFTTQNSELPSDDIRALGVDSDGTLWIGTGDGYIVTYDGKLWQMIDRLPGTGFLQENDYLQEDGYLKKTPQFQTPRSRSDAEKESQAAAILTALTITRDGHVWAATAGTGLFHFDGSGWVCYQAVNSCLPGNGLRALLPDPVDASAVWVSLAGGGLTRFDDTGCATPTDLGWQIPLAEVYALAIDAAGRLWVSNGRDNLVQSAADAWDTQKLPQTVTTIYADPHGDIWLGTKEGLVLIRE